ncbi:DUF2939 domain-containing protein [Prochlorococcus sp. MIT 1341]|uniref:DUF2939 domain-containing protein n=1 Tax=Prochlorococcus sp. MIT 1341 TaxID=3096221 RepID=UPI002A75A476|nr:DUF2939 domain-containing protein [Prochlorococcus sp. MIT 1341]
MGFNVHNKSRKGISSLILLGIISFSIYIYISPYLSILAFKRALENKNPTEASEYIDFPSVRKNLKAQLINKLSEEINKEIQFTPFGELTMVMVNPIINKVVSSTIDSTVSPNGLKVLLTQGKLSMDKNLAKNDKGYAKEHDSRKKYAENRIKLYYESLNVFILASQLQNSDEIIKASWRRQGISNWKINIIELPNQIIKGIRF